MFGESGIIDATRNRSTPIVTPPSWPQPSPTSPAVTMQLGTLAALPTAQAVLVMKNYATQTGRKLGPLSAAKNTYRRWGVGLRYTPAYVGLTPQLDSARELVNRVPALVDALAAAGLEEVVPTAALGRRVHERLQVLYLMQAGNSTVVTDRTVYKSAAEIGTLAQFNDDPPLSTGDLETDAILQLSDYALVWANPGRNQPERNLRPDILDLDQRMIFEIKPIRAAVDGVEQLWAYQVFLNAPLSAYPNAPQFVPGTWQIPWKLIPISDDGKVCALTFMFPGYGARARIEGVVLYVLVLVEVSIEEDALEAAAAAVLRSVMAAASPALATSPAQAPGSQHLPPPAGGGDVETEHPDTWTPGDPSFPGPKVPPGVFVPEPAWDQPAANDDPDADADTGQEPQPQAAREQDGSDSKVLFYLFVVCCVVVGIILLILLLPEDVAAAALVLAAVAAIGEMLTVAIEIEAVVALAGMIIARFGGSTGSAAYSSTTPAMLASLNAGPGGLGAQFAGFLAQLPGLPAGVLAKLAGLGG